MSNIIVAVVLLIMVSIAIALAGCSFIDLEVNMVQRATLADGEDITSHQKDTNFDDEDDTMEIIVPIK